MIRIYECCPYDRGSDTGCVQYLPVHHEVLRLANNVKPLHPGSNGPEAASHNVIGSGGYQSSAMLRIAGEAFRNCSFWFRIRIWLVQSTLSAF